MADDVGQTLIKFRIRKFTGSWSQERNQVNYVHTAYITAFLKIWVVEEFKIDKSTYSYLPLDELYPCARQVMCTVEVKWKCMNRKIRKTITLPNHKYQSHSENPKPFTRQHCTGFQHCLSLGLPKCFNSMSCTTEMYVVVISPSATRNCFWPRGLRFTLRRTREAFPL